MQDKNSEKNSELFNRIQTLRLRLGITWRAMANKLGVADNSLFFHMRKGRTGLSDKVIFRLKEAELAAGIPQVVKEQPDEYVAGSPTIRLMEIEKEQQQISRQLAATDSLRLRYTQLLEEQIDIMCRLGMTQHYTDEQIAAIRARCASKAALLRKNNGGNTGAKQSEP